MSIGTSFKTTDVSAFFTALMMRDLRRGILNMRSNDFMTWRLYFMLAVLIMMRRLRRVAETEATRVAGQDPQDEPYLAEGLIQLELNQTLALSF